MTDGLFYCLVDVCVVVLHGSSFDAQLVEAIFVELFNIQRGQIAKPNVIPLEIWDNSPFYVCLVSRISISFHCVLDEVQPGKHEIGKEHIRRHPGFSSFHVRCDGVLIAMSDLHQLFQS